MGRKNHKPSFKSSTNLHKIISTTPSIFFEIQSIIHRKNTAFYINCFAKIMVIYQSKMRIKP